MLYDSNSMAFWKMQNGRDSNRISGYHGLGKREGLIQ